MTRTTAALGLAATAVIGIVGVLTTTGQALLGTGRMDGRWTESLFLMGYLTMLAMVRVRALFTVLCTALGGLPREVCPVPFRRS